ncbi:unnamed protein product [Protopolystoma xenopodis]|uniref:Uncharacterized protein n=1 Tax=Protopolystoma xenopodis TaxID=117903 RepID=A0A448X445_9PLAT|nr:unnamed protein product [Protopolystoma xenopodis]
MFPGYPSYVSIPAARTNLLSNALSTLGSSLDLSSPAFSNHTPLSSVVSPLMLNPACIQQMQSLQGLHIPGLASSAVLSMLNNSSPNITSEQGIHLENGLFLPNDRISSILNCFGYADLNSSMLTAEPSAPIAPANIDTLNAGNLNNSGLVKECDSHTIIRAPVLYKTSVSQPS